jgi:tetratricopeptide (TPR) repeat protein
VPDRLAAIELRGQMGQLHLKRGDLERAWAVLREGWALFAEGDVIHPAYVVSLRNGWAEAHILAAERSAETARADKLRKTNEACRAARKKGRNFPGRLPEANRLQGTCEWLRGKPAAARKWWERSLKLAEDLKQRYDLGMTHLEMGRRLDDITHLERAEALFAEIGAEWDLAQARKALARRS